MLAGLAEERRAAGRDTAPDALALLDRLITGSGTTADGDTRTTEA